MCVFDDSNDDSIQKIEEKIKEVKELKTKEESYKIDEFENILYKIGVSVVLIAHQKTGIMGEKGSQGVHHSFSESVADPAQWIKTGYINAFEYQKPKVQGIIKNNLKELKAKYATITGSDCHVWSAYPKKYNFQMSNNELKRRRKNV